MSVAGITTVGKLANNLILRHPKKIYQDHINDLSAYVSQLDNHIANMRQYRTELHQFWEGESAEKYAALLEIELRSLEQSRTIVNDDIALYKGLIADLDSTTGITGSIIDDATSALNALTSELSNAASAGGGSGSFGGGAGGGGIR